MRRLFLQQAAQDVCNAVYLRPEKISAGKTVPDGRYDLLAAARSADQQQPGAGFQTEFAGEIQEFFGGIAGVDVDNGDADIVERCGLQQVNAGGRIGADE